MDTDVLTLIAAKKKRIQRLDGKQCRFRSSCSLRAANSSESTLFANSAIFVSGANK